MSTNDAVERLRADCGMALRMGDNALVTVQAQDLRAALADLAAARAELAQRDARIVAWLRVYSQGWNGIAGTAIRCSADAIKAGAHHGGDTPPPVRTDGE